MSTYKSNRMCSVPQCKNRRKDTVSLHVFPADKILKKKWQVILKIGKPITKNMFVCSEHFSEDSFFYFDPDINTTRRLKRHALPSRKLPVRPSDKPTNAKGVTQSNLRLKHLKKRSSNAVTRADVDCSCSSENHNQAITLAADFENTDCVNESLSASENRNQATDFENTECVNECLDRELTAVEALLQLQNSLQTEVEIGLTCVDKACEANLFTQPEVPLTILELLKTDSNLNACTGIYSFQLLKQLEKSCWLLLKDEENLKLDVSSRIVMTMIKIKLNISFTCISVLFGLNLSTCTNYFYKMVQLLSTVLKEAIVWPSKEEILCNMPTYFVHFKDTRIVLDCTKVNIEKPRCLRCRIGTYSHYKGANTMKVLIGTSPGGLITFCSSTFGGRASDKAITTQSKVLDMLEPYADAVMVDKGFRIDKECAVRGIKLIRPPFLNKSKQFTVRDGNKTADIARARVHVERAIQRLKIFKIIKDLFPWRLLPYADDIFIIACGLANLGKPILSLNRF